VGARVVTLSDSDGTVYDADGIDPEKLAFIRDLKEHRRPRWRRCICCSPVGSFRAVEGRQCWGPAWPGHDVRRALVGETRSAPDPDGPREPQGASVVDRSSVAWETDVREPALASPEWCEPPDRVAPMRSGGLDGKDSSPCVIAAVARLGWAPRARQCPGVHCEWLNAHRP
jgi:hypothetical protein